VAQHNDLKIAYNQTFNSVSGKTVLDDLMTFCHMREPAKDCSATELAIREGRRDTIAYILERMNKTNLEVVKMITEGVQ
jgi:hypothetical protein